MKTLNSNTCRILFASFLSALCLIALSTQAATITVTNTNDDGAGSLRRAIANANNGDTIHFGVMGTIILTTGELLVDKSITINGPGSDNLTVDGNFAGRVFHVSSGVTATIAGLTITNGNIQFQDLTIGGGIYNDHATLALDSCTVHSNYAGYGGGGVYSNGALTLTNSTITGNWAAAPYGVGIGGGICNEAGTLTVSNCTISGNGGAAYAFTPLGGGIYNDSALTITNSTLSGNSAAWGAGGVYNWGGTVTIGNTILKTGIGENISNNYGTVSSLGYNLSSDDAGGLLTGMGDQINTDPMLGPLQYNGGPTSTHAPLTGSPAIDAGKNFTAATRDQRGAEFVRTFDDSSIANASGGDGTDIGAYEVQGPPSQYAASIQQPINADGTSVFNGRRGVVPVKFILTLGGVATCNLPPATISVTRTAGGVIGPIDESDYTGSADNGSNFRIDTCEYVYNLSTGALGAGTYRVDIIINGQVVGSATFGLR
jgi:predicted outer membrane repeat protein